jgi:hypothetical protein
MKSETEALEKVFGELSQKLYAQAQAQGAAPGAEGPADNGGAYDADFKDVSDDNK